MFNIFKKSFGLKNKIKNSVSKFNDYLHLAKDIIKRKTEKTLVFLAPFKKVFLVIFLMFFSATLAWGIVSLRDIGFQRPPESQVIINSNEEEYQLNPMVENFNEDYYQSDASSSPSFPLEEEADAGNTTDVKESTTEGDDAQNEVEIDIEETAAIPDNNFIYPIDVDYTRGFEFTYHDIYRDYRFNSGLDFAADVGTPIWAAMDGNVESIESCEMGNFRVILNHEGDWKSLYSNVTDLTVKEGDSISAGELLAEVGAPKIESSIGPYLHFKLLYREEAVNPLEHLP